MSQALSWESKWEEPLGGYLSSYASLFGDKRSRRTFGAIVRGIIGAGSLVCTQIAAHAAELAQVKDGAQRVIRFAQGESTQRSSVNAEELTARLRERGVAQLAEGTSEEVWLIADSSDLRKPYAKRLPALMQVRQLDGALVPGYRTLTVLGVVPGRRGILYHRLFSSEEPGFISEPHEVQVALQTVSAAISPLKAERAVSWLLDSGFDDVAVWRTIWEQQEHLVCRVKHQNRHLEYETVQGEWQPGALSQALLHLRPLATAQTEMVVTRGRQPSPKLQPVTAEIAACPLRLSYESNVRRNEAGAVRQQELWLVEVRLLKTKLEPWLLITDWPVEEAESALRLFRMYRQRWAVEESFKFTKGCLGWEEVQLLDLRAIRTLLALAWVAAGFLYELGVTLEWPEVQLLARLGGWSMRKDRKPGKIVLTRGLQRILDMLVTKALLAAYQHEHGALPPRIAALLARHGPL